MKLAVAAFPLDGHHSLGVNRIPKGREGGEGCRGRDGRGVGGGREGCRGREGRDVGGGRGGV